MSKEEFAKKVIDLRDDVVIDDETRAVELIHLVQEFLGIQLM